VKGYHTLAPTLQGGCPASRTYTENSLEDEGEETSVVVQQEDDEVPIITFQIISDLEANEIY
jgi:hypothetical protein